MEKYDNLKTFILCCFTICIAIGNLSAQKCKTSTIRAQKLIQYPEMQERIDQIELETQKWIKENASSASQREVVTLSVVVHVLHNAPSENISDAQIISQLDVLNQDFRKLNANYYDNTPAPFRAVAADAEIEFCLAGIDPSGNPTNGITRTSVTNNFDIENDYWDSAYGGKDAWDVSKYINVWIGKLSIGNLGFATPPGSASNGNDDGIVIDYRAWGTVGAAADNAPNNLGRTATHEFGHYFNLEHMWGPGNGGCNQDDFVNDTPNQDSPNFGCGTYPETDNCTGGFGLMFMNFMDYSDDACMTMFSQGQKERMLAALNGPRVGLLNSTCALTSAVDVKEENLIKVYPNPAKDFLLIESDDNNIVQMELINVEGQVVKISKSIDRFDLHEIETGVYFLKIIQKNKSTIKKIMLIK